MWICEESLQNRLILSPAAVLPRAPDCHSLQWLSHCLLPWTTEQRNGSQQPPDLGNCVPRPLSAGRQQVLLRSSHPLLSELKSLQPYVPCGSSTCHLASRSHRGRARPSGVSTAGSEVSSSVFWKAPPVMVLLPSRKGVKDFTKFMSCGPLSGQLMLWVTPR